MKSLSLLLSLIVINTVLIAQTPQTFKYQAVARDLSGNVLVAKNVSFRISILQGSAAGTSVYSEKHTKTTNSFGLVDLEIGNGTSPTGSFSAINWAGNIYFLKVEMDPNGASAFQFMGTSQLLSVPYAIQSKKAEEVADNSITSAKIANNAVTVAKLPAGATSSTFLRGDGTWQTPAGGASTTPYGNDGDIQFKNGTNFFASQLLHWDNTNYRLGIGTNSPIASLQISANGSTTNPHLLLFGNSNTNFPAIKFKNTSGENQWLIRGVTQNSFDYNNHLFITFNNENIVDFAGTGNVGIGGEPFDGYKFTVIQSTNNLGGIYAICSGTKPAIIANNTSETGVAAFFNGLIKIAGANGEINQEKTGTANMMPFAYGYINSTGVKSSVTSNIGTVTKAGTGQYKIEIDGLGTDYIVTATPNQGTAYLVSVVTARTSTYFSIGIWDTKNDAYADGAFSFVVYKP